MPLEHGLGGGLHERFTVVARGVFGVRVLNHLAAVRKRGRRVPYDPQAAWDGRYRQAVEEGGIDDKATITRHADPLKASYHYNAVENAILEWALNVSFPERPAILDVGSGAGHWIDFYRSVFDARRVVGIEFAGPAAAALRSKYAAESDVSIEECDVAGDLELGERFDIVTAVDVLFHIVDDTLWRHAIQNLARHLVPGGRLVIAGNVSRLSYDAGLRAPDAERGDTLADHVFVVTKRVRSLHQWKTCGSEAGLTLTQNSHLRQSRTLATPANLLLVFTRPESR